MFALPFAPAFAPAQTRSRFGQRRGFTLIELMVVIVIIGILAIIAVPSMSLASFDRDAYSDAGAIMQVFRSARTRAIARGSAVVVQMVKNATYPNGAVFTYEAVAPNPNAAAGSQTPVANCKYPTDWTISALNAIDGYAISTTTGSTDVLAGISAQPIVYTAGSVTGSTFTEGYVCYTPLGRSYVTISPTVAGAPPLATSGKPVFSGLSSVSAIEIKVTRTDGATVRSVLVPNNGMARLFSHT